MSRVMRAAGLDTVFLAAPTSTDRAAETGGAIFERFRLSGFAHGRHRRARIRFRAVAPLVERMRAVTELRSPSGSASRGPSM